MSSDSTSSEVTYTSISSHWDPLAWAADFFRLQELDSPEAAPAPPDYVPGPEEPEQAPLSPDFVPGTEYPKYLAPSDEEVPIEDQPYVTYTADGGDGDDDDSSDDDEEEEEAEEEEAEEEEEEHLAPADSVVALVVDHVPHSEETEPFEDDEVGGSPPSPQECHTTARISMTRGTVYLPHEEEGKHCRCLVAPTLIDLTLPPLPSSPLPPLPDSLFIPPVDRREDVPEAELPPRKRLCLTTPASRYEMGESSTAVPRPAGGLGYGIRDTWIDMRETAEEVAPVTLEGVNTRVTELAAVQEQDTQDIYAMIKDTQDRQTHIHQTVEALVDDRQYHYKTARLLDQEALVSREAWAHSIGFSSAVHYELQGYRTHGHLAMALGEIQALKARE
ncbi:hypothetical protein Tco_0040498 [Tanacetum coccineum]